MDVSWDLLRTFLVVAETGSLSAAARRLATAQPTVRRHIAELEATLSVALFTRSNSGLRATAAATALRPYAEDIAALAAAAVRAASRRDDAQHGTVRLTCSAIMATEVLPGLLAPFLAAHPRIDVEISATDRNEDLLRRDADIAVRMARPTQSGLVAQKVGEVELGLFAAHSYLDRAGGPPATPADLAGHRLIGEDRGSAIRSALEALTGGEQLRFGFRTDDDTVQWTALRAGVGIGICQVPLAARDHTLERVLPSLQARLDIWLATHEDLREQPLIRTVVTFLRDALRTYAIGTAPPAVTS